VPDARRRIACFACLLAIVALRLSPDLIQFPFIDRHLIAEEIGSSADGGWKRYVQFLQRVRECTKPGDSIAIVAPAMRWDEGYSYAYYRGSYFLTGREVLPLVTAGDLAHPENFTRATYIAAWHARLPGGHYRIVCRGDGGALLQRE